MLETIAIIVPHGVRQEIPAWYAKKAIEQLNCDGERDLSVRFRDFRARKRTPLGTKGLIGRFPGGILVTAVTLFEWQA
jgi:hypothetical protein